ncbi:uncharacterized protein [Cicer arietinum]|uniref:Uncharacterized protein LOC101490980 n=1 Tax=Cicer arietinum TaxID=3827 RepID=A0A1S2XI69_CICAR|nr:uncharacterized protein LOC101490980 [Cicer arietinum]
MVEPEAESKHLSVHDLKPESVAEPKIEFVAKEIHEHVSDLKLKESTNLNPNIAVQVVIDIDVEMYFITDNKYKCRDDFIVWVLRQATKSRFLLVITKFDHGCAIISRQPNNGILVLPGSHNHEMDKKLEGHLVVGHLNEEDKELGEMTRNMVLPQNILMTLKAKRNEIVATMKQIYDARQRYKKTIRGPRSEM